MVEKLQSKSVVSRHPKAQQRPLIVIPCLNEARYIAGLLHQLEGPGARLDGHIVVVDGGSTDGTCDIVAKVAATNPRISLLHNPDRIQSAAINLAVARDTTHATHLIRMDAHSRYPDDFCEVLMLQARSVHADSIVVSMIAEGSTLLQKINAATQNSAIGNGGAQHRNTPSAQYVDHGHHALLRISTFKKIGGYDPAFSHNEDAELDHRLRQAGGRIWLTSSVTITYFPRLSLSAIARQYFNFGTGRARNLLKHNVVPRLRQTKVMSVLPAVVLTGFSGLHWAFALPAILWSVTCLLAGIAIAARQSRSALALCGPVAMLMHLTWSFGFWQQVLRSTFSGDTPRPRAAS